MKQPLNNDQTLFERLRLEPILAAVGTSFFIQLQPMFFWGGESIVNVSWFINATLTAGLAGLRGGRHVVGKAVANDATNQA